MSNFIVGPRPASAFVGPTANNAFVGPPTTPLPAFAVTVELIYDNSLDLAPEVLFETVEFVAEVNGRPGSCKFRLRDYPLTATLVPGKSLVLKINGLNAWSGYVTKAGRGYAFDAEDVSGANASPRFFQVEGADLNTLFRRRIVFDVANPTNGYGKTYAYSGTPTMDSTAIAELVANWLDLSGDNLDLTTKVETVAAINVDQAVNPWSSSWTWEQAMTSIASLPAAVFYIDPDRFLVYTDVDTANAPRILTDIPTDADARYRDMEIIYDGSDLINDELVWGMGTGRKVPVFKRLTSAGSLADHGRWQSSEIHYDVYKQATADRIADSIVNGSPSSRRGHKNDKIAVRCTTFNIGFRAGQKARFISTAYGFDQVVPIRRLRITFPSPYVPQFDLDLSTEIDVPWSFYDIFYPRLGFPRFHWSLPILATNGCSAFDDFQRVHNTPPSLSTEVAGSVADTRSLFRKNFTTVSDAGAATPASFADVYWGTNIAGFDPDGYALVGAGIREGSPSSTRDYHYDNEVRTFWAASRTNLPTNCTHIRITKRVSAGVYTAPTWEHDSLQDTVLVIRSGLWPSGGVPNSDFTATSNEVARYTIASGSASLTSDLEWDPVDGVPDYSIYLDVSRDGSGDIIGAGDRWLGDDLTTLYFSPTHMLLKRYDLENYSLSVSWTDILGGHHDGWAQNDAKDHWSVASSDLVGLRVVADYPGVPGWGQGPLINWDIAEATGDIWSDAVLVDGNYGVLATHASPITGVDSSARASHSVAIKGPVDNLFKIKFSNVTTPPANYHDGVYAQIGLGDLRNFVYPDADVIEFNAVAVANPAGFDWTDWVWFRQQADSSHTRLKWWQGGSEPDNWMVVNNVTFTSGTYDWQLVAQQPYTRNLQMLVWTGPCEQGSGEKTDIVRPTTTALTIDPYFSGTTSIWKNGGVLIPGGVDYTETNHLTGSITLGVAPVDGDVYVVRYRVATSTGGARVNPNAGRRRST